MELSASDDQIRHIIDKSLTVLNHTNLDIVTTRRTVNQLIDVTGALDSRVQELMSFQQFVLHFLQIQANVVLIRTSVNEFVHELGSLRDKITQAVQGHVTPHLLSPYRLKEVLKQIHDHLDANVQLPFSQHEPLDRFYKVLKCSMIPTDNGFLFVTHVPLRDTISQFEIYGIQTVPIPFQNTDIVARYEIEQKHFCYFWLFWMNFSYVYVCMIVYDFVQLLRQFTLRPLYRIIVLCPYFWRNRLLSKIVMPWCQYQMCHLRQLIK